VGYVECCSSSSIPGCLPEKVLVECLQVEGRMRLTVVAKSLRRGTDLYDPVSVSILHARACVFHTSIMANISTLVASTARE
jgi:hypothetical protein